ncbi:uncharacterized protein LOC135400046 [Ornithodoros turicata]|uniref:uncharacterized protein LOC135400046 n=1 Tax=Ornithodoros turicata TaxID=34597 RepID=UPI003138C2F1
MKVLAFTLMFLALISFVTSLCESEAESAAGCVLKEKENWKFDDVESLDLFMYIVCCITEDIERCVRRHLTGPCSASASAASETARNDFFDLLGAELEDDFCEARSGPSCNDLKSRFGN